MSNGKALPLKKGDRVILTIGDKRQEGEVVGSQERKTSSRVTLRGEFGKATMRIRSKREASVLELEFEQYDAEGRKLLQDG